MLTSSDSFRFLMAAVFITAGLSIWMLFGLSLGFSVATIATLFMMRPEQFKSEVSGRDLRALSGLLLGLFVVGGAISLGVVVYVASPTREMIGQFFRHPLIVVPLWLVLLRGVFQIWKRRQSESHSTS